MNKIAIVTDAWHPQINGVVTTLTQTVKHLENMGHRVKVINPHLFRSIPCPSYPEIRLALAWTRQLKKLLTEFAPNAVHIATEGPLGWAARSACLKKKFPYTTSYHTRFPEYIKMRFPIPLSWSYTVVRKFHKQATRVMVATLALRDELSQRNFPNTAPWSRGVNTELFQPDTRIDLGVEGPVQVYVGRVAVEKNIEAFLSLDLPGTKVIVGDGPARKELERKYPEALFAGYRRGKELAGYIANADVMVFPSLTDTFGVVMLEANGCGVPVAAYPVTGPINVVKNGVNGWLDQDLQIAVHKAMEVSRESCRNTALQYSWKACSEQFFNNLEIVEPFGSSNHASAANA
ncbi:glycosyltransferase family 4 protein [Desulfosediminicola sp.]|uniref:glycosyltransferase family 4 protein n=1 Tax=Desulfosediminicola sp. TaxID=2886825 RepID=UPI003AF2CC92